MAEVPQAFRRPSLDGKVDPLRFCVATTVALIAWLITPPLAVTVFGVIGLYMYWKARRAGLLKSRCLLGDTRWVMVYLSVLAAAGLVFTVRNLL
ncbi:MAG: hypothetical protein ACRDWH_03310 [Acidimicrobiia bacterium]